MFFRGGVKDKRLEAKAKYTKKSEARLRTALPRTDPLEAMDRNARGQGQGPRTQAQVFSNKKRSSNNFFRRSPKREKKGLRKLSARILAFSDNVLTIQKVVLSSAEKKAIFEDLTFEAKAVLKDSISYVLPF